MSEIYDCRRIALKSRGSPASDILWATREMSFKPMPIFAHIQLTSFHLMNARDYYPHVPFDDQWTYAFLRTVKPGAWKTHERDDTSVLKNDASWLEFELESNGVQSCSALGIVHDLTGDAPSGVAHKWEYLIFDEDGWVIGTHSADQLDGGESLDLDEIQERVLGRASARVDRELDIIPVNLSDLPANADIRIDMRTRRPVPRDS